MRIVNVLEDFQAYRKTNNIKDKVGKLEKTFDTSHFLNEQNKEAEEPSDGRPNLPMNDTNTSFLLNQTIDL